MSATVKILKSTFLSFPKKFFLKILREVATIRDAMQFIAIDLFFSASDLEELLRQSEKGFIGCLIANWKDDLELSPDLVRVLEQYNGTVLVLKKTDGDVLARVFENAKSEIGVQLILNEGGTVFIIYISY